MGFGGYRPKDYVKPQMDPEMKAEYERLKKEIADEEAAAKGGIKSE